MLNSMHKFQPRVHLVLLEGRHLPPVHDLSKVGWMGTAALAQYVTTSTKNVLAVPVFVKVGVNLDFFTNYETPEI